MFRHKILAVALLLLLDEFKSVLEGDKNVIFDNFSIASTSLSVFLALSCLHKFLSTCKALSCTLSCVSWQAISKIFCGTLYVISLSVNLWLTKLPIAAKQKS